jgi:plasmid replication initiation protein
MKNPPTIVKSNELIEARYKLSLNEQRLVLLLTSIIEPEDEDFRDYQLWVADFADMFGLKGDKDIHSKVEQAADAMVGKRLYLKNGNEKEVVAWISYATYKKGEGIITIRFDKSLKPYLLQLKSHFTQYQLTTVVKFKSQYSIRLYELLKAFEYRGRGGPFYRELKIDELKSLFGVSKGEYKRIQDFRRYSIEPAVEEVSNFSEILITQVEYIKAGRAIGSVKFTAEPKAGKSIVGDEPAKADATEEKEPPEHIKTLLDFGIAEPMARKWANQYGQKKITEACAYVRAKQAAGEVKDAPAYLAKTLENDYHLAWLADEAKKKAKLAEEQARKARQEAEERDRHRQASQKIAETLEAFHALPEAEQEQLRDRFEAENHSIVMKSWKKRRANNEHPENVKMFSGIFAYFLDAIPTTGA